MSPFIDFIVDGKRFTIRSDWDLIPRVGDAVILGDRWVEVTRVLWSDDSAANAAGLTRQWVQLVCKTISDASEEPL
jgi:hypothetical protein